ncbi:MAG: hypothetical protein HFJ80_03405 [Clostridiales bacterium]|nr:hypothetical protein [Clostridiales bacterium]
MKSELADFSGVYEDDDETEGSLWEEETGDEPPAFEPYTLQVQRKELSVYDQPGYNTGNWLYDITDRRSIIIVAEKTIRENGNTRTWGQLQSGGWVSLTAASVIEEEEAADTDAPLGNNRTTEFAETSAPTSSRETEPAQEQPAVREGTPVDDVANVYGCGGEHTAEVNGIQFHWYDRYEHRSRDNTMVFSSLDILSFDLHYTEQETLIDQNDIWYIDYETAVSSGSSAKLRWITYDENQYRKEDVPVLNGDIKGKGKGTAWFAEAQMPPSAVAFAELAPSMYGRS